MCMEIEAAAPNNEMRKQRQTTHRGEGGGRRWAQGRIRSKVGENYKGKAGRRVRANVVQ